MTDNTITQTQVEEAIRTLLAYVGEDASREGLQDTPKRVAKAFREYCSGYGQDPAEILKTRFEEVEHYDEMVILRDIHFNSHCEHHLAPFYGVAHVAYIPNKSVVGLSKLARLVDVYARRLQIQEKMTSQIATALEEHLKPKGVAVVIEGTHMCMTTRGVNKPGATMQTSKLTGLFRSDPRTRKEFFDLIRKTQ